MKNRMLELRIDFCQLILGSAVTGQQLEGEKRIQCAIRLRKDANVDILAVWLNIVESSNQKSYKVWGESMWFEKRSGILGSSGLNMSFQVRSLGLLLMLVVPINGWTTLFAGVWNYQTRESGDNGNFLGSWNSPK